MGIESIQALFYLSRIIALENVDWYAQCFGIPYLLWLATVIASGSEEDVSLLQVSDDSQLPLPFFSSLLQSGPVSAEKVESQGLFFRLPLLLVFP